MFNFICVNLRANLIERRQRRFLLLFDIRFIAKHTHTHTCRQPAKLKQGEAFNVCKLCKLPQAKQKHSLNFDKSASSLFFSHNQRALLLLLRLLLLLLPYYPHAEALTELSAVQSRREPSAASLPRTHPVDLFRTQSAAAAAVSESLKLFVL